MMTLNKDSSPAEVRSAWADALESGKYKQGHERLRDGDKFCCLGVLCDLAAQAGVGVWEEEGYFNASESRFGRSNVALPDPVVEWAGLTTFNGQLKRPEWRGSVFCDGLAGANDHLEYNFGQIAALIREGKVRTTDA
jgi:hypothetical protein